MRNQRRLESGGDFAAPDAKAKSSGAASVVYSCVTDRLRQRWVRYSGPRSTSVGFGPWRELRQIRAPN